MLVQRTRCYFLYNVPVTEHLLSSDDDFSIGASRQLIERLGQRFQVRPADVPAFYTAHYRDEHTPYLVTDAGAPQQTCLSKDRLKAIGFFAGLELSQDISVSWEFMLSLQGVGLVTVCLDVADPLPSEQAYRLGGLHLNPAYAVIASEPIKYLWPEAQARPDYVSVDDLARAVHSYFFSACGLNVHRYRALQHEIQIPFMAIEVDTECASQSEFLEEQALALAELVFKPACWEVEHTSQRHARHILDESRVWGVARDAFFVAAYEGGLYVKLRGLGAGVMQEVSGFRLADESAVLHSFKVAVSNYHFLRILDDLLDDELQRLVQVVARHQRVLGESPGDDAALREMDQFIIQTMKLHFQLADLLEEIDNSDKLIDEEWHIVLLDKLNAALGTRAWFDSVERRIENLHDLVQTVESTYEKLTSLSISRNIERFNGQLLQLSIESQKVEGRLKRAQPFFEALAAVEAINLLISIWFDPEYAMVGAISQWLGAPVGVLPRLVGTLGALVALFLTIRIIRWAANLLVRESAP